MRKASQSTPDITGISEQMGRIEAKLDWIMEALAGDEGDDDVPPEVAVATLDGGVRRLPVGDGGGFL